MRALSPLAALGALALADPALAQRSADNAVTAADDAFGSSIGNESIGLYTPSQVRGFSPVSAGNVRLDGVYLDRQGTLSQRLVAGSTIRVGLSAQGYLFPAPTGIVDYRLRGVGPKPVISVLAGSMAYGAPTLEIDAQLPLAGERLGVAAGASWAHEEYYDGSDARYTRLALIPRWKPADTIEIVPFWSATFGRDEQVAPTVVTAGPFAPPNAPRRRYFGQDWAAKDSRSLNMGVMGKARLGAAYTLTGGVFRSSFRNVQNFAELFVDTAADGLTREQIIADPGQNYASTSGEVKVSRTFVEGPRLHVLHATVRARQVDSRYGGAAPALDLGLRRLGERMPVPQPDHFVFSEQTHDRVRQVTVGIAYEARWRDVGELSFGVQRADYRKTIDLPSALETAQDAERPWLVNGAAAVHVSKAVALYAGHTRGLEESGLAPASAANRNAALPAIRTTQSDAGVRWTVSPRLKVVAGVFDIRKPYFNTDEANIYTVLGDVRHRGVELSLSGAPTDTISLVAGAVLIKPRVTGAAVELGRVGERPLGQPTAVVRGNLEYRPPALRGFSIDLAAAYTGRRPSSRDNLAWLPAYGVLDIGARYRFQIGGSPATLRLQLANVTNSYAWSVSGSNSYGLMDKRRALAFLAVDF